MNFYFMNFHRFQSLPIHPIENMPADTVVFWENSTLVFAILTWDDIH